MPSIIFADMENLIRKTDKCANNPENTSAIKVGEHIPCGYLISTIWTFDHIGKKHTLYCGKDEIFADFHNASNYDYHFFYKRIIKRV